MSIEAAGPSSELGLSLLRELRVREPGNIDTLTRLVTALLAAPDVEAIANANHSSHQKHTKKNKKKAKKHAVPAVGAGAGGLQSTAAAAAAAARMLCVAQVGTRAPQTGWQSVLMTCVRSGSVARLHSAPRRLVGLSVATAHTNVSPVCEMRGLGLGLVMMCCSYTPRMKGFAGRTARLFSRYNRGSACVICRQPLVTLSRSG
jgi:hypothetical protein